MQDVLIQQILQEILMEYYNVQHLHVVNVLKFDVVIQWVYYVMN